MDNTVRVMQNDQGGDPSYLKIGSKDGLALGVKLGVRVDPPYVLVGLRVRLANNSETPYEERMDIAYYLETSSFGAFNWQKVNGSRASFGISGKVPFFPADTVDTTKARFDKAGFINALLEPVYSNFAMDVEHPRNDVEAYIQERSDFAVSEHLKAWGSIYEKATIVMPVIDHLPGKGKEDSDN